MVIPHRKLSIDINRPNQYTIDFIAHVGDKNTRYIDITFNADGEPIELEQGCAAIVTYVSDGVLIEQAAECDVDGSTVIVGIDTGKVENLRSGILEIQPKIVDGSGNIIVSQIPVLVRISPDIAEHGQIKDDSLGSYAEVVREIAAARGSYTNLKERLDHTGAPTDEQVAEAVEEYFDEHPISGAEKFVEVTDTSDTAVDNCTDPDTVYIVRVVSNVVTTTKMRVICTPNVAGQMAQYAMTKDGYIISRKFTASEWEAWDFIPDSKRVAAMISTAIAGKVDKVTGKGLSTNDYTTAEKNKLANLEPGNSIWKTTTAPTAPETSESPGYGFTISTLTGADRDVQIGDMILYSYYYYTVTSIIGTTAYADTRVSIRGAKGATGAQGDDYVLTAQDKEEIAGIVYEIGATPQYVIDESESVLAKAFAHKGLGRTIRFIAVSDSHNDAAKASHDYTRVSNLHCGQAVKYIADRIPLDFVASLGDMTWAGVAHTTAQYQTDWLKADIQEMNMFLKDGFSGVPNIRVVGNHDQCATTDSGGTVSRLQNNGAYQYFGRYNAGVNDGLSNYGYYDIDNVKLRIIYLNTSDTVSTTSQGTLLNVSQEQKNWLCETLIDVNSKTDAANWKILLLSHAPLDMVSGIAADILIPYTNGGTYGSYTFTNHNAKIIGNCHGHTHCYRVDYMADKIRRFTIPNSNFYDNNHYKDNANYSAWNEDTTYPKTANSRTDTSFSLVTVDLDSLTCYVDNYGAGYDREFSVDYNNVSPSYTNQIPISVDTNGNIYNGTGYKDDTGISSAGVERTKTGNLATGFIPYNYGDTIRIDRFDTTATGDKNNGGVFFYNESKTYLGAKRLPTYVTEGKVIDGEPLVDTPESPVYDAGAGSDKVITSAKFIRVVFYDKSGQGENLIVTINEEM